MEKTANSAGQHSWNFTRRGGIFQAQLKNVEDLRALGSLDPKLWVALSCPVNDLEIDRRTLSLIDNDADDRVRIEEMLTAVEWTLARLSAPHSLFAGGDLPLSAIETGHEEGVKLLASAKRILANMGAADAKTISVEVPSQGRPLPVPHRGRLFRWRLGQPDRRSQRSLPRPTGLALGQHHRASDRKPDQHSRSLPPSLRAGRPFPG